MSAFFKSCRRCAMGLAAALCCAGPAVSAGPIEPAATQHALSPTQAAPSVALTPTSPVKPPNSASGGATSSPASAVVDEPGADPAEFPKSADPATEPPLPSEQPGGPPAVVASPLQAAIEAALTAFVSQDVKTNPIGAGDWRAAREAIQAFYAAHDFAPIWVGPKGLTPAGVSALSRLGRSEEDGLDLAAFALPKSALSDASPEQLGEAETVISAAVVAYAMQASGSRLDPRRISSVISARPSVADPSAALAAVAAAANPDAALEGYNPQQRGYLDLRDQLARLRAAAPGAAPRIPTGPSLGIGMVDPRVPLVRARLRLGPPPDDKNALVYDLRLASAVAAFQRANGLPVNGALTPGTAEALSNDPATRREAMILANMEMWRWEPRSMGDERIEINIPDYSLRLMEGDTLVHEARVIVGKPNTPTPVFSNEVRYILVNPIWRVPDSIIKKEMEPKLAEDPDYLTRRGFEVTQVGDRLVVRQPPGEANALGRILFMFPNEHAVYLHDTPSRALFAASRRAFSHGCVRLEQPMRLAELVMGGASAGWTVKRWQSLLGAKERTVFLPHTIPIHIEYFTEFVDGSGALQDREDIYGIARRVATTIARINQD